MSTIYRGPSENASYQIAIHLPKRFQRSIFFRNQPIRNKNCLWRPCLLLDRYKMSNLYRAPSIDASYQVLDHLAKGFQMRRLKCEKSMDNRRWMPSDGIAFGKVSKTKKKDFFLTHLPTMSAYRTLQYLLILLWLNDSQQTELSLTNWPLIAGLHDFAIIPA